LIAGEAKKATAHDLVIAGDLNLNFSLTPRIAVKGVTFANAKWGSKPHMVKVNRFATEMQLIPLISDQIKINQVILVGVELLPRKIRRAKPIGKSDRQRWPNRLINSGVTLAMQPLSPWSTTSI